MVHPQCTVGIQGETYRWRGVRINKSLGHAKSTLTGIRKNNTKVESHEGIAEWIVRDLGIEDSLQIEI